ALENKDDPHHEGAKTLDRELLKEDALLLLHWGILFEIADGFARVGRRARGLQLLAKFEGEKGYLLSPITKPLLQEALHLIPNATGFRSQNLSALSAAPARWRHPTRARHRWPPAPSRLRPGSTVRPDRGRRPRELAVSRT